MFECATFMAVLFAPIYLNIMRFSTLMHSHSITIAWKKQLYFVLELEVKTKKKEY